MNYKEFIQKYEELLNSGYCECNELNCLDNNPPKKILNIMKEQQQEIERLNNIIKEVREYIEDKWEMELKDSIKDFLDHDERIERKRIEHILEILGSEKE